MSGTHAAKHSREGDWVSCRGSIGLDEAGAIAFRLASGLPVAAVARMYGRSLPDVQAISAGVQRATREPYVHRRVRGPVVFSFGSAPPEHPLMTIARQVAEKHRTSVAEIRGRSRLKVYTPPRQEFFWRACHETAFSTTQIGVWCGGRDHTTAMHNRDAHQDRLDAAEKARAA